MAPRLMHTKSRAGCTRCKSRKVKCDEMKPICGACRKHGVDCHFPPRSHRQSSPPHVGPNGLSMGSYPTPGSQSSSPNIVSAGGGAASLDPQFSRGLPDSFNASIDAADTLIPGVYASGNGNRLAETTERRMLELQLMYRYMASFRDMFAGIQKSAMVDVWGNTVPRLALTHPFLLHAMFAVTALHYITTVPGSQARDHGSQVQVQHRDQHLISPVNSADMRMDGIAETTSSLRAGSSDPLLDIMKNARVLYFNLAIPEQYEAISNLNAENADAACISTILISNSGFLLTHDLELGPSSYAPPVKWLWLASGIHAIIEQTRSQNMLTPDSATLRIVESTGNLAFDKFDVPENEVFFAPLMKFQREIETETDLQIYSQVVRLMGHIRTGFIQDDSIAMCTRRTMAFASLIPRKYISLVNDHRPRALVILACFFAMTKDIESVWWFRGAAHRHVNGLRTLIPSSWQVLLEWPLALIETPSATQRTVLYQRAEMNS